MKVNLYAAERYEGAYDVEMDGSREYAEAISQRHVKFYRAKEIYAGKLLEIDCGAIWNTRAEASRAREAMKKQSAAVVEARNQRNTERRITQIINANFTDGDLGLYLSFGEEPESMEQVRKAMDWYTRKLRAAYRARFGAELRYVYILETDDADGAPLRPHYHVFLNNAGAGCRDLAEDLWRNKFGRANATRLETDEYGLTGFAKYVLKAPRKRKNQRRWACSRNCAMPEVRRTTRLRGGKRITKRLMQEMVAGNRDAAAVFEAAYPGYAMVDARPCRSEYVGGIYLYIRMRRMEENTCVKRIRRIDNASE